MNDQLNQMYREIILDHYRSPRGRKPVDKADIQSNGHNPACGDVISMQVEVENGEVKNIHVDCQGCAISVASGSMLAELVKGRSLEDLKQMSEVIRKMLKGEIEEVPEDYGDIDSLKGVRQFPVRIKCALLAWITLLEGLKKYESGSTEIADASTE